MSKKEKIFLLKGLDRIKQLTKIKRRIKQLTKIKRKSKYECEKKYPFVKIFELHLESTPPGVIAKRVKIAPGTVSAIINGLITIPRFKVKYVRELGYKICTCCKRRIVPLEPINYTILTTLCAVCWKSESNQEEFKVDPNIPKGLYK